MNERAIFLLILGGKSLFDWIRLRDHQGRVIIEAHTRIDDWYNYPPHTRNIS